MYKDYSMEAIKTALTEGKKVALFFHASRCPACVAANKDFMAMSLADNSVIFKVDYDTMTDLKKQYGVTSQHTFVFLNTDMTASSVKMGLTAAQAIDMLK
jgi:thioredoxin 1